VTGTKLYRLVTEAERHVYINNLALGVIGSAKVSGSVNILGSPTGGHPQQVPVVAPIGLLLGSGADVGDGDLGKPGVDCRTARGPMFAEPVL